MNNFNMYYIMFVSFLILFFCFTRVYVVGIKKYKIGIYNNLNIILKMYII